MYEKKKDTDRLRDLFSQLPEKRLPGNFRSELMEKIRQEAVRIKKREEHKERNGLFITIALAAFFLVTGSIALVLLELPKPEMRMPDLSTIPFFAYIGTLVLILLAADYKVRKHFYEKQDK